MSECDKCEGTGYLLYGQDRGNIEQENPNRESFDRDHSCLTYSRVVELREAADKARNEMCAVPMYGLLGGHIVSFKAARDRLRKALEAMDSK